MAIIEMKKLNLIAMAYDKDCLLNALQRTGAVEVVTHLAVENTVVAPVNVEEGRERLARVEAALTALCAEVERYEKETKIVSGTLKDGFSVTYSDFLAAQEREEELNLSISKINALIDERNTYKNDLAKLRREIKTAEIYSFLEVPFSTFSNTAHTRVRLGSVASNIYPALQEAFSEIALAECNCLYENGESCVILTVSHNAVSVEVDGVLSSFGFVESSNKSVFSGKEVYGQLLDKEKAILDSIYENERAVYEMKDFIRPLKIYSDALSFEVEKRMLSEKMRETASTFLLQAFVPSTMVEEVEEAVKSVTNAVYFEFSEPTEEDTPPTLLQNSSLVGNFEDITNTYSAPHYREFDPNAVMGFFYSLFMGFIIGDAGYGLLMLLIGGYLWWKNRKAPTGTSRLAGAFACGGVFALIFGGLFNSFFGIAIFGAENTIMPDPQKGMCSFIGIEVPSVLVIALVIGIVHLLVGYVCKAVQEFRRGNVVDGIFDGIMWAMFSLGVALAIAGLVEFRKYPQINLSFFAPIGVVMAGASLLIAVVAAARKGKGFTRFTKSFGAAYGVINYASDILSYARLYGLMLSGAVVAQIISSAALGFFAGGNPILIVLAVVLLIVGHAFNLVMNLLGAYIHDARLQYVEFYGRFFEGDGELFAPLGSKHKYVKLIK